MNQLLDTVGAFLYLGFNIIVFPVLLLAKIFILALILTKYLKVRIRNIKGSLAKRERPLLRFPAHLELDHGRMRLRLHR